MTVTLSAGERFFDTGAGAALTWDLAGNPTVTITGLDTTTFTFSHNGTSTGNLDGTGKWFYEIDCTSAGCSSGGSHPYLGPLTFTIDNITTADFIINGKTSTGYEFASNICTQIGTDRTCAGITGDVVASDAPAPAPIPEPATLSIFLARRCWDWERSFNGGIARRQRRSCDKLAAPCSCDNHDPEIVQFA